MAQSSSPVEPYSIWGRDLFEVGEVIFGGHGHAALPKKGKCGAAVEDGGVLGVDVEDVDLAGRVGGVCFKDT